MYKSMLQAETLPAQTFGYVDYKNGIWKMCYYVSFLQIWLHMISINCKITNFYVFAYFFENMIIVVG